MRRKHEVWNSSIIKPLLYQLAMVSPVGATTTVMGDPFLALATLIE